MEIALAGGDHFLGGKGGDYCSALREGAGGRESSFTTTKKGGVPTSATTGVNARERPSMCGVWVFVGGALGALGLSFRTHPEDSIERW